MANNIDWDKLEQNQTDDIDWDNLDQSVITNKDDRFGYGTAIKTGILGALGNAIGTLDRTVVAEAKPSYMSDAEWESKQGPVHRYIQDFAKDLESSNRVQFDPWSGKNIAQGVAGIVPYAAALAPAAALAMRGGNADALRSAGIGLASKAGLGAKGTQLAGEAFPALGIGTLGAIPEARMEGQSAYEEAIQEGKTEAQANTIKNAVTAYNMALLSGTNAIELATAFGKISSFLPQGTKTRLAAKLAGIGASEGIQEGVQEAIPNIASDKPIDWDAVAQSTVVGGLGGVLLGGAGMGANYAFDKFGNKTTTADDVIQSATQAPTLQTGDNGKESFINAIAGQESGGNYDAQNADSGAFGKYQIMPENWPAWAQEAGLGADAAQTPENQEKVARFKLGQYYDKYGPRGAALAWYGGEGALNYSDEALNRKQGENGEYPSLNEYANSVLERMGVATYSNNDIDAARQFLQDREGTFDDPLTNNLIHDILQSGNDNDILNTAEQIGWKTKKADDITKTEKQPEAEAEENVVSEFTDLDLSTPQQTVTQTNIPRKFKQSSNLSGYKKFFNEEATRKNQYIKDLVQKQRDIITSGKQKSIDYDWYLAEQAKNTGRMVSGADREKVINKALNNSKITMLAKNAMSGNKSAQQAFSKMSPDVKQALLNREADRLQIENEDIAKQQYPDIAKTPFMPAGYYYDKELYKRFLQKKEQEAQPKQSSENEIAALVSAARENAKILNNKNIRLLSEKAKTGNASAQQAFNKISPKVRDFLEYIEANRTKEEMRQGAQEYIQSAYAGNEVKGLKAELKAANEDLEQLLSTALQDLQSGMGQGVTLVPNEDPDKPDRYIRVSNNAQWYSDFYKANKRKPNKRELLDLAIDLYTGKDSHGLSNWYDNGTEEARKYFKENAKNVAYYENLIETYENMLNEYSQKAQTTQQVEPQDEKKEQPKEKVEEVKKPAEKAKETKKEKKTKKPKPDAKFTNKNEKLFPQVAEIRNDEITVVSKLSEKAINNERYVGSDQLPDGEYSFTIGEWKQAERKSGNKNYAHKKFVESKYMEAFPNTVSGGEVKYFEDPVHDRIIDSQIAAIKEAVNYYETKNAAQEQPPAATEEVKATFSDSKTAEDNLAKLLGLTKKKQEPKKAFNVIDDSDAALEEALKELKSEVNKLSANPVFNPDLHKAAFKVGMIYLQRGTNKFADWSKQMIAAVGEKIRPWLGSIWKSIEVYPKNEKLNPEIMSTAVDFVGAKYNEGLRSADEIYQYMVDNYGEEQAKPFKGLIESAFAGIDELYNPTINVEEAAQETPQDQVEETKPAVEKPIEKPIEDVKAKFNINEAQNGIEIKFAEKPSEEFLDKLKAVGYRWSRFKKHWYAKQTPKAMSFAESIGFIPEEKGGITDETTPDNTRTEAGEVGNIETAGTDAGNVPEGRDTSVAGGSRSEELDNEVEGTAAENDTTVSENGSVEGESDAAAAVEGSTADISSGRVQDVLNGREGGSESRADVVDRNSSTVNGNYHIDNPAVLLGGSAKTRFAKNKQAIEIINNIISENRHATPEEKDILAAYSGWGSFGQELFQGTWENPKPKKGWEEENQWLRDNLGEEAWKSAQNSILNAHYTDPVTVQTMWAMLEKMGFKGGKILEPSMGVGNFFGLMPKKIMEQSQLTGIELDTITGRMAKELYPKANIQIKGYQDSKTADNFYDVIIGNVPFANYSPNDRRYNKFNATLHDYFFLKGLDQLRPGGIMIAITSKGTMDKADRKVRIALARKADLVTAYRMPTGAFENYAGTQVVTDILVFKKRDKEAEKVAELPWVNTEEHEGGYYNGQEQKYRVNKFFEEHPENVLGEMKFSLTGNMGRPGIQVKRKDDFAQRIEMLPSEVPLNIYEEAKYDQNIQYISNYTKEQQGSVVANDKDNKLYIVEGDYLRPIESVKKYALKDAKKTEARENELKQLIKLRKAYGQLIDAERSGNEDVEKYRKNLNVVYDQYVKDYGKLSSSWGMKYFKSIQEPAFDYLSALENDNGNKATIFKQSTIRTNKRLEKPSVKQAFIIDRNEHKNIDVNRIAELSKTPVEKVVKELVDSGAIFKTPNGNYDLADVYLSGNVRVKLKEAQEALAAGDNDMEHNIEELKKVIPPTIPYFNIETNLGAAWISKQDYIDFIAHLLNVKDVSKIKIIERNGGWTIKFFDSSLNSKPEAVTKYGTGDISFSSLLTHAFNHTKPIIRGPEVDGVKPIDNEKTEKANSKIEAIYDEFQQWLWSSNERKLRLEKEYNEAMNSVAIPQYDGSFMEMPGMALQRGDTQFTLRQHQLNAIYRGIINGSGIYAHEVGTGKTYTMGGIALESRRYGIAKKPLILAHNANSASVAKEIQEMYPGAKILYIDNLNPKSIKRKLNQIMVDDWDVVVMPHSQISKLSLTEETLRELAEDKITALEDTAIEVANEEGETLTVEDMDAILNGDAKMVRSTTAKNLIRQRNQILQNIEKQAEQATSENSIPFENLGIDMIIVDEAHEFKKPPFETKRKMKGLNNQLSGKSVKLNFLTEYLQRKNNGKGVHIFTGTPITNTLVELYHMMKYVMPSEMKDANVYNFDSWFNVFAAEVSDVEITNTGEYEPVSRLAAFTNVSELRRMAGQYLDIVFADDMPEFKPRETKSGKTLNDPNLTEEEKVELLDGRTENPVGRPYKRIVNEVIPLNTPTQMVLNKLVAYAKKFKNATKKERKEMLKNGSPETPIMVETAASNAGMDVRLYDPNLFVPEQEDSKEKRLVKNVVNIYNEHPKTVQVIFMDRGLSDTKKVSDRNEPGEKKTYHTEAAFNMAKDIIDQLVANGIKQDEIVLMKSTYSPEKRKEIADKLKKAEYRVVIGSTATLGVGVNMQDNLRAMHHLDAPWMPGLLEQRNGRGHRQGNKWNTVLEIRYITERIDGKRWQTLTIKDKFIKSFMKAKEGIRTIEGDAVDLSEDGAGNDFTETLSKAAADQRILLKAKYETDIAKLEKKERIFVYGIEEAKEKIVSLKQANQAAEKSLKELQADEATYKKAKEKPFEIELAGSLDYERKKPIKFVERKAASEHLQKIQKQIVGLDNAMKLGTFAGFDLYISKAKNLTGTESYPISIRGEGVYEAVNSLASIESKLNNLTKQVQNKKSLLEQNKESIKSLEEATKGTFPQAETLAKKRQLLDDITKDLEESPVPPPDWLVQGAPLDSDVYIDNVLHTVNGHKATPEGFYLSVVNEKTDQTSVIPFQNAKDAQGMDIYDTTEHTPSPAYKKKSNQPAEENKQFSLAKPAAKTLTPAEANKWRNKIADTFKNMPLEQNGNNFKVTLPNGRNITIDVVDKVLATDEQLERAKQEHGFTAEETVLVEGYNDILDVNAIMQLLDTADTGVLDHEILHAAKRMGLTDKENAFLDSKMSEEEQAEDYRAWRSKRIKSSFAGKLWQKIVDFANQVRALMGFENKDNIYRQIETGKVWDNRINVQEGNKTFSIENITSTKAFKEWFKGSKIVDKNGNPLVVYHGTVDNTWSEYDSTKKPSEHQTFANPNSIYLSTKESVAKTYLDLDTAPIDAKTKREILKTELPENIKPFKMLKIDGYEYLFECDDKGKITGRYIEDNSNLAITFRSNGTLKTAPKDLFEKALKKRSNEYFAIEGRNNSYNIKNLVTNYPAQKFDGKRGGLINDLKLALYKNKSIKAGSEVRPLYVKITNPFIVDYKGENSMSPITVNGKTFGTHGLYGVRSIVEIEEYARNNGYDGVIAKNVIDVGGSRYTFDDDKVADTIIAFYPNQIKSVNNTGTFSIDNNNIYYSIKPAVSDIKFSIQKANENLAKNIEIREKRYGEGFNLTESVLRSPSWIAEKFPKFKLFFEYANEAMQKQEYLRSWYDRTLKRIDKRLKDKENKKDYQELLWAGDSEGREFTRAELKQQGYNDDVIAAYLTTRQAMAKTYNLLNDARKQVRTYQKNVTAEGLQELKDNQFAEILSVQNNGSDYLVAYKMPKTWERSMAVSAAVLEDLKNDKNIQVLKEEKIADDKFAVKYRQSAADIVKRGGYIPHFFHEWFIMDKSTDQDGKESYTVLGSGRTQSEAVKQAEELLKTNPKANIVISPKQFSLDSEENARAAVIGDSEYQEVVSRIAKDMEMTIAETKDFLQGKLKVKGRHRFFGNFMQRKGAEGFEQDLDWVLRHYFNSSARYVALEDFKPRAIGLFERYFGRFDNDYSGKPLANYVKHYINDINGNPSALETIINNMLNNSEWYKKHVVSHFGERAALQIAGTITGAISMLKLGFLNFSSAFLNMTQLINTVGLLGSVGDVTTGFAKAMKPSISDQKIFSETGIYNDIGMDTTSGYNRFNPIKCGQLGMYFFRKSDVLARKATVLAAYKNARGKGMTHKEAIEYAKDVNRKANFDYSVADAPNVFRRGSIIAQLALQFKKYPIKELELMYEIATKGTIKQNAKFWGMYFLIAGMLQFPAAEMFDELWKELFGQSPKNEIKRAIFEAAGNDPLLKEMANVAVYGVGALANADLSRRTGLGDVNPANLPSSIGEILFGPTYSTIKQSIAGIPAMLDGNPLPVIKALSPGAANYIQAAQGYSENRRGRKLTDYETTYDQILKAAGFRSVDESKAYDVENIIKEERSNRTKERAAIIDKTIEKLNNGETLSKEDIQELQRLRVTGKQLKEERAKKANSSTGRMKENLSKEERYKYQSLINTL